MKKLTIIALLLVVITACEKADIRPRTSGCMEPTPEAKDLSIETPAPDGTGNPNALGGGGSGTDNPTVDPNSPDPEGEDITDPLRKKDQKDNK